MTTHYKQSLAAFALLLSAFISSRRQRSNRSQVRPSTLS